MHCGVIARFRVRSECVEDRPSIGFVSVGGMASRRAPQQVRVPRRPRGRVDGARPSAAPVRRVRLATQLLSAEHRKAREKHQTPSLARDGVERDAARLISG
jgi:hypothetical protein